MTTQILYNSFIFNDKIDHEFILGLYDGDYTYIEKIFEMTAGQLAQELTELERAYQGNDPVALGSTVHKLKPGFGYTGLPLLQEQCQTFEDLCRNATHSAELEHAYSVLWQELKSALALLQYEAKRLSGYNAASK
ncbi:MAG: hypothetical protein RL732_689 [Bacteroidota bacterium]